MRFLSIFNGLPWFYGQENKQGQTAATFGMRMDFMVSLWISVHSVIRNNSGILRKGHGLQVHYLLKKYLKPEVPLNASIFLKWDHIDKSLSAANKGSKGNYCQITVRRKERSWRREIFLKSSLWIIFTSFFQMRPLSTLIDKAKQRD